MEKQKTKVAKTPSNLGKILYQYIPRKVAGILNPKHVLYDGKLDSSNDKFHVLRDDSGRFVLNLNPTEKAWLEHELKLYNDELNIQDRNNEYLKGIVVEMPKSGISLDTTDAWEFLVDKILMAYDNIIAPNSKSKKHKRSYRYVRLQDKEEAVDYLIDMDTKKLAYKRLGAIEQSREKMIMLVLFDKIRISPNIDIKDLRKLVNKMADSSPSRFISIVDDPLFTEKGLLKMGVYTKAIELRSGLHYFQEEPLAAKDEPATYAKAAIYLADKTNSDVKLALSNEVLNEFNGVK